MSTPVTLGLYAAGLALVFGAATAVGAAVGPVGTPTPDEHRPVPSAPAAGHETTTSH